MQETTIINVKKELLLPTGALIFATSFVFRNKRQPYVLYTCSFNQSERYEFTRPLAFRAQISIF